MDRKPITAAEENDAEQYDIIQMEGINSKGFGILPKMLMQDARLSVVAKAIYAYFCSYAGAGQQAFPRVSKIIKDLDISKNTYYKHFGQLRDCGYIKAEQKYCNGRLANNIYTLMQMIPKSNLQCPKKCDTVKDGSVLQCPKIQDTVIQDTVNCDTNNNNSIENQQYFKNISDSLSSPSLTDRPGITEIPGQNDLNKFIVSVKKKISFQDLQASYPYQTDLIEEIVSVIIDVMISDSSHVRIEGEDKPRGLVKHVFSHLTYDHVEFVIKQFKNFSGRIQKKRQYFITMLYNSYHELDAHYINEVKSDSG